MLAKRVRPEWERYKRQLALVRLRAARRRWWWRERLRAVGVEPSLLSPDDPIWRECWSWPRGFWLDVVAAEMRAEAPGVPLRERLDEVIERVAAITAAWERGEPDPLYTRAVASLATIPLVY